MATLACFLTFYGIAYGSTSSSSESFDENGSNFLQQTNGFVHNAYHIRQTSTFTTLLDKTDITVFIPVYQSSNPQLSTLLDNNVCGIELDVFPKDNVNDNDFPIRHVRTYDTQSTCVALSTCLSQISQWMSNNEQKQSCPINIELHLKTLLSNYQFSNIDLILINNIVENAFTKDQLYTPKTHQAQPIDVHWPGFNENEDGITNNNVFVGINKEVIEMLYPNAINVAANNDNPNAYENQYNLFATCPDPYYARYCVVMSIWSGNINPNYPIKIPDQDRGKYVFTKYVGEKFIQLPEYPLIKSGDNYLVSLPESVTKDANYWIEQMQLEALGIPTTLVPYTLWNAWMLLAYFDAMGNNDGIINAEELSNAAHEISLGTPGIAAQVQIALTTEDIWQLGIPLTIDGMYVNNPLAWLGFKPLLGQIGDKRLVPKTNLNAVILETCQAIQYGYTYVLTDYVYQIDEPYQNGNVWPFTFADIDCSIVGIELNDPSNSESFENGLIDWVNNDNNKLILNDNGREYHLTIRLNHKSMEFFWSFVALFGIVSFTVYCYYGYKHK